ncbi:YHS domain-containing (seleno)protein [Pelagibius sp.]|uniref:YHS domain-containing (seleno)protein n=1 Tax=Pelagibius sp. TaxID=1931238 RepID=UPI003BAE4913
MTLSKLALASLLAASMLGFTATAQAADELNVVPGYSIAGAPLALHGYDPVAYFTKGAPMRGSDSLVHIHEGAAYRFASQAHLDSFKQDPDRYVPQYGGFCAYGVSVGKKFDGDPRLWKIEDGKLYLNLNEEIYATFLEDLDDNIEKAEDNWQDIEHVAARDL